MSDSHSTSGPTAEDTAVLHYQSSWLVDQVSLVLTAFFFYNNQLIQCSDQPTGLIMKNRDVCLAVDPLVEMTV